jgi:hypothetical protein
MMKTLSVLGTVAMFLVGGGILTHGFSAIGHGIESFAEGLGDMAEATVPILANGLFGLVAGLLLVVVLTPLLKRLQKSEAQQN